MKFIADGMLGKLVRWLRLFGQDVTYIGDFSVDPKEEDDVLLNRAEKESRILITRDTDLHRRALRESIESVLIEETQDVAKQLVKVSKSIGEPIRGDIEDSRCSVCNGKLKVAEKTSISEEVPDPVLKENERFWKCVDCGKIYWVGGHWENMAETIKRYENLKG
ncbi:hypothetical protein AKJ65_03920 [candidate division MSBL1 archaeon SCGC-AAA259E19]|uniref:Mut7-C RNAse domain-containing protein n=1 Tax=candidate division MSBL1 archaeon SCGC-AAA259E19 TaxID=1698264 RepID=A0A133UK82_9EURY|nr:hypothetical protein AKJ65_03920 [candidate division MSBL1 archaeon SCGC-AAA259E19]